MVLIRYNKSSRNKPLSTISCKFRLVAQIRRMSTGIDWLLPTRTMLLCWMAVSSLACKWKGRFPISSRNRELRSAASNLPVRSAWASVKEPFTCPNSSLSNKDSVIAPISTDIMLSAERGDKAWISRASISFPVPFSPVISIFALVVATFSINVRSCCIALLSPQYMAETGDDSFLRFFFFPSFACEAAFKRVSNSFWLSHGFTTKSDAPSFIPRTARSISA